jgi:hypothetical protein
MLSEPSVEEPEEPEPEAPRSPHVPIPQEKAEKVWKEIFKGSSREEAAEMVPHFRVRKPEGTVAKKLEGKAALEAAVLLACRTKALRAQSEQVRRQTREVLEKIGAADVASCRVRDLIGAQSEEMKGAAATLARLAAARASASSLNVALKREVCAARKTGPVMGSAETR